jgi:hypothetical protein
MSRHARRRPGLIDAVALNMLALAWLARGLWRVSRGRAPWSPRPR